MINIKHSLNSLIVDTPELVIGFAGVENQSNFGLLSISEALKNTLDKMLLSDLIVGLNKTAKLHNEGKFHRPNKGDDDKTMLLTWHSKIWLVRCQELLSPKRGGSHLRYSMYDVSAQIYGYTQKLSENRLPSILDRLISQFSLLDLKSILSEETELNTSFCCFYPDQRIWSEDLVLVLRHIMNNANKFQWYIFQDSANTEIQKTRHDLLKAGIEFCQHLSEKNPKAFEIFVDRVYQNERFYSFHEDQQIHFSYWLLQLFVQYSYMEGGINDYEINHNLALSFVICWNNQNKYDFIDENDVIIKMLVCISSCREIKKLWHK